MLVKVKLEAGMGHRAGNLVSIVAAIFGSGNICSEKTEERTNEGRHGRKRELKRAMRGGCILV